MKKFIDFLNENITRIKYEKIVKKVEEDEDCMNELKTLDFSDEQSTNKFIDKYFDKNQFYKNSYDDKAKLLRRVKDDLTKNEVITVVIPHSI
jgi:hypothetical protein